MLIHNIPKQVLFDCIQREIAGIAYCCDEDRDVLNALISDINTTLNQDINYVAELAHCTIPGCGVIIAKYIHRFQTESVKAYMLHHLVSDNVPNYEEMILKLYLQFRESDAYISAPGKSAPAHICTRYDDALRCSRNRYVKEKLVELASNPRDIVYLPFTMRKVASWKMPEVEAIIIRHISSDNINAQDVGIYSDDMLPPLNFIKKELQFWAIDGLKHYPSQNNLETIRLYIDDIDPNIASAAKKTYKLLIKGIEKWEMVGSKPQKSGATD